MQTIEERIESLERSNRRLRGAGIVCGLVLVGTLVVGANQEAEPKRHVYEDLYAKKLTIVDEIGQPTVILKTGTLGGELDLYGHDRDAACAFTPLQLLMLNLNGNILFQVGVNDEGDGLLSTRSKQGKALVTLSSTTAGGDVFTYSKQGKDLVRITSSDSGDGLVTTFNSEGKELVALASFKGDGPHAGSGMVAVFDPTGRTKRGVLTTQE